MRYLETKMDRTGFGVGYVWGVRPGDFQVSGLCS